MFMYSTTLFLFNTEHEPAKKGRYPERNKKKTHTQFNYSIIYYLNQYYYYSHNNNIFSNTQTTLNKHQSMKAIWPLCALVIEPFVCLL